jgi:hypothetical protein
LETLEEVVARRAIKELAHFTRMENVGGILRHGIVARNQARGLPKPPLVNDPERFDGHLDASCLSISFPNYRMFYRLRCDDPSARWAVLLLLPSVLLSNDCAFFVENAASSSASATQLSVLKGPGALERLFDEIDGRPSRQTMRLPDSYPTNPQAEVLVFGTIAANNITRVVLQSGEGLAALKADHPEATFVVDSTYFSPRFDWENWKTEERPLPPAPPFEAISQPRVTAPRAGQVRDGSTVVLADGQVHTIGQTCSLHSPVGSALLGHVAGETVTATLPRGNVVEMRIVEVRT